MAARQGADPWAVSRSTGKSALHFAALRGREACVDAVLDNLLDEALQCGDTRCGGRVQHLETSYSIAFQVPSPPSPPLFAIRTKHIGDVTYQVFRST